MNVKKAALGIVILALSHNTYAEMTQDRIIIEPDHKSCVEDADCTSIDTMCNSIGCECGSPVNIAFLDKYIAMVTVCRAAGNPTHCELSCPQLSQSCSNGQCIRTAAITPPLALRLSAQKTRFTLNEIISLDLELKNIGSNEWPVINLSEEKGSCFSAFNVVIFSIKKAAGKKLNFHKHSEDYYPDERSTTLKQNESIQTVCSLNDTRLQNFAQFEEPGEYEISATYYGLGYAGYGTYRNDKTISNAVLITIEQ